MDTSRKRVPRAAAAHVLLGCCATLWAGCLLSQEGGEVPREWRPVVTAGEQGAGMIKRVQENPELFDWGPGSTLNSSDNTVVVGDGVSAGPAVTHETLRQEYERVQLEMAGLDRSMARVRKKIEEKEPLRAALSGKIEAARGAMLEKMAEYQRLRDEYEVHIEALVAQGYAERSPSLDTISDDDPRNPVRYNLATAKLNAFKEARAKADDWSAIVDRLTEERRAIPAERRKLEAELELLRREKARKQKELQDISERAGLIGEGVQQSTTPHSATRNNGVDEVYFDSGTAHVDVTPRGARIDNVYVPPVKVPAKPKGFLDKVKDAADRLRDYWESD